MEATLLLTLITASNCETMKSSLRRHVQTCKFFLTIDHFATGQTISGALKMATGVKVVERSHFWFEHFCPIHLRFQAARQGNKNPRRRRFSFSIG